MTITGTKSAFRAERIPARDDETDVQVIHLPEAMLREVQARAAQLGRTTDWCINTAWCVATIEFEAHGGGGVTDKAELLGGKVKRLRVELALLTWRHITQEAERLDRSKSWMLQRAWLIARSRLPSPQPQ